MYGTFEEKGKIFTEVIRKTPVGVLIQTTSHLISGLLHVKLDDRLKDEINKSDTFIAVTDATVQNNEGEIMYRTNFLAVNRNQITWIIPIDEIQPLKDENE